MRIKAATAHSVVKTAPNNPWAKLSIPLHNVNTEHMLAVTNGQEKISTIWKAPMVKSGHWLVTAVLLHFLFLLKKNLF